MTGSDQIDLAHAQPFRLGPIAVEPALRQVSGGDGPSSETLEPRVMQVLVVLAMANGGIVSRDDLVRQCWEGRIVGDDSINRVIARLRKLADDRAAHGFHIETITKVGYRLIGSIELIESQQPAPLTARPATAAPLPAFEAHPVDAVAPADAAYSPPPAAPTPLLSQPVQIERGPDRRLVIGGGIVAAALGSGAIAWRSGVFDGAGKATNSVAVLPFANLGNDPDQSYFSDGLAAEIRAELARNPRLEVTAQASSNKFRDSRRDGKDDAKSIASALGVAYLLDGNVRRSGSTVRVSAELVDGRSGFSQWSQTFDRPLADVFAVQREIASAIDIALNAEVGSDDSGGNDKGSLGGTENVIAFDAFLQGKSLFEQGIDEASDRAALAMFDAAIAADPRYGNAHAARARSLTVIGNQYAEGTERRELFDNALAAAYLAVSLSPSNANAYSALGFVLFNGRLNAKAARAPYDKSWELGRGDADIVGRYALFCARIGRFDVARTAMARAAALDRLNARSFRWQGEIEYSARRFAESIPPLDRALQLNPKLGVVRSALGASRLMLGDLAAARAAFAAEPNRLFGLPGLAIIDHRQGRIAQAKAAMAALIAENGDNSLYQQAQIITQWGDLDGGMRTLLAAQASGDAGIMYSRNDPFLDALRPRAEFQRLQRSLGFV